MDSESQQSELVFAELAYASSNSPYIGAWWNTVDGKPALRILVTGRLARAATPCTRPLVGRLATPSRPLFRTEFKTTAIYPHHLDLERLRQLKATAPAQAAETILRDYCRAVSDEPLRTHRGTPDELLAHLRTVARLNRDTVELHCFASIADARSGAAKPTGSLLLDDLRAWFGPYGTVARLESNGAVRRWPHRIVVSGGASEGEPSAHQRLALIALLQTFYDRAAGTLGLDDERCAAALAELGRRP